jgi:serine/threonine protein kinase
LIDFGHASFYRSPEEHEARRQRPVMFKSYGTPVFSPPEVRSGMKFLGPEADVYALGLMLYEMTFGDLPINFDSAYFTENGSCIFSVTEAEGFYNPDLQDLILWMLSPDPMNRPTISEIQQHRWLQN